MAETVAMCAARRLPEIEPGALDEILGFSEQVSEFMYSTLSIDDPGSIDFVMLDRMWEEEVAAKAVLIALARYGLCKGLAEIAANAT